MEQVFRNNVKTVVLLTVLGVLFMGIGALFGQGGFLIGAMLAFVFVGGSYWFSDKIAVKAAGAVPVSEAEAPRLYGIVRELTTRAGLPMPSIYISPAAQPNAFATGRNPQHAAVAVTQGLMQVVDDDELRGVLAHELSHVRNRDILISSVAAAIALGITFLARMLMWGAMFGMGGGGGRNRNEGNIFGVLAMMILAPIAAMLLQASLSRSREFEADRSGAELLGTGEPLARALEKIDTYAKQVPMNVDPAHATAYIINPLAGRKANFASMFQTHPPTEERIARLRHVHVH
ncbi:MAG TPA: zinc metalloprotease HtpX [Acidimicrobiia bacterium]|nr:zinc metalloprotease HtpX [Acidimicrobiia bacterium]